MTDTERQIDGLSRSLVWQHIRRRGYSEVGISNQGALGSKKNRMDLA